MRGKRKRKENKQTDKKGREIDDKNAKITKGE